MLLTNIVALLIVALLIVGVLLTAVVVAIVAIVAVVAVAVVAGASCCLLLPTAVADCFWCLLDCKNVSKRIENGPCAMSESSCCQRFPKSSLLYSLCSHLLDSVGQSKRCKANNANSFFIRCCCCCWLFLIPL